MICPNCCEINKRESPMAGLLIAIDNDPEATGSVHERALGKVFGDRAGDADDGDDEGMRLRR